MNRKWTVALVTMFAFSVLVAGMSIADDEGGPAHEVMEKVGAKNNAIKKATRTAVAYKKSQKDLPGLAEELAKLAKETKDLAKDVAKSAKNVKDAEKQWTEYSEAFAKAADEFHTKVKDGSVTQSDAKKAFGTVGQSCTKCHEVFRVDE